MSSTNEHLNNNNNFTDIVGVPTNDELTEYEDEEKILFQKVDKFCALLEKSQRFVIFSGAGLSTSCGLPDYRSAKTGVWTLIAQGKKPTAKVDMQEANPSYAHMAIASLVQHGKCTQVVTTNMDGLHTRSGVVDKYLSELHGSIYCERCEKCDIMHRRWFDVRPQKRGFIQYRRDTGRLCERKVNGATCKGKLRDSIINFGENLPEDQLNKAYAHAKKADLTLVLGTSMRVSPACDLPSMAFEKGRNSHVCIVNLQKTPFDDVCDKSGGVRVFSKIDKFMAMVMDRLKLSVKTPPTFDVFEAQFATSPGDDPSQRLIVDPDVDTKSPLFKYAVMCMADGPPPKAVLDVISNQSFNFRRKGVQTKSSTGIEVGKVVT